jgi:ribosomal protein S18
MPRKARTRKRRSDRDSRRKKPRVRVCYFCKEKVDYVDYKEVAILRRYVSDRGKIRSRQVTGNCQQHQRKVATAVKNAREMALLPYTNLRKQEDITGRRGRR